MTALQDLHLSENRIRGLPGTLSNMVSLRRVYLDKNLLSGPIPLALGELPALQDVDLSGNVGLSGPLPPGFCSNLFDAYCNIPTACVPSACASNHVCNAARPCHDDCRALSELYKATNGKQWLQADGWATAINNNNGCCDWHGVTCAVNSSSVVSVSLPSNGLRGTIPPLPLPFLEVLDLSGNALSGHIPNVLGSRRVRVSVLSVHAYSMNACKKNY